MMVNSGTAHTVGIVDDHELILDGLSGWFAAHADDVSVVATATSWIDMARHPAFPPQVVLMDLQLREPISLEARIRICRSVGASVVVLSALDAPENERRSLDAGAAAFVSKARPAEDLLAVLRSVLGSGTASSGAVPWDEPSLTRRTAASSTRFSDDEEETLRLYASGHSPVEVAMILGTNIQAVKNALERVREQYSSEGRQADRKQDLVLRAAEDGYLA